MNNETSQTRFWQQLRLYGFKRFVLSADFLIAMAVLITMLLDQFFTLNVFSSPDSSYVIAVFAAASTLFAITLAALAIILSFSSSEFVAFLRQHNKLSKLLFLFWSGNIAYLLVITFSMIYLLMNAEFFLSVKNVILYPVTTALFVYALIDTFYILGAVIRFGHFLDLYEKAKDKGVQSPD